MQIRKINNSQGLSSGFGLSCLVFIFAAIWVCAHFYRGIWHDGALYLGQALLHLRPDVYAQDLFFKYGSQDQFTIFSPIYAWAIEHFGVGTASIGLLLIGQALFAVTLVFCCTALFGKEVGLLSACAVMLVSRFYGGENVFSYSEAFLTARTFAEPLCLFAVWLILKARFGWSFLFSVLAALFHPLTALPCLFLWWISLISINRKWLWLAVAAPALPALALAGVPPFDGLLQTYDSEWWSLVERVNHQVIPALWGIKSWALLGMDIILICLGMHLLKAQRGFLRNVFLVGVIGFLASIVATSWLQNILLTSLQLWRTHWILHLFAMSLLPVLVLHLWPQGGTARLAALFVIIAAYLANVGLASCGVALLAVGLFCLHKRGVSLSREIVWMLWGTAILIVLIKTGAGVMVALRPENSLPGVTSHGGQTQKLIFAFPVLWLAGIGLARLASSERYRVLALGVAVLGFCVSVSAWDQRTPWRKYVESSQLASHPFRSHLSAKHDVFWYEELVTPWLSLGTTSYFETSQGAGILFNRATAIEFSRREESVNILRFQVGLCNISDFLNESKASECEPSHEVITEICSTSPDLEAIVMPWKIQGMHSIHWSTVLPKEKRETTYYLYKCKSLQS
jgi:hypothetical protein